MVGSVTVTSVKVNVGEKLSPVSIEGRAIARTFWGRAWCDNLERYSDYANRLPRGRTYVRNGSVMHLRVGPGSVEVAQRHHGEAVGLAVALQHLLAEALGDAVGTHRLAWQVLGDRQPLRLAVDRAGRREDEPLHARLAHRAVELDNAEEVAVVGQGQTLHAVLRGQPGQVLDPAGPVEQAEVTVDV